MSGFKTYHPVVNFTYFVFAIGFSCFFMHPVSLCISLVCGFIYSVILKGRRAIKTNLIYILPMMIAMALINTAFNHEGVTVMGYLPSGNPVTVESVVYGLCAAIMIVSVICWFSCYNEVMTSDKIMYLFGKIIPAISLVVSMTLRFVPKFAAQLKVVANAQKCMGRDVSKGSIIERAKHGIGILSVMITWSLENAVDTADSMRSRGYGLPGRTHFSIFAFDKRDIKSLLFILVSGIYIIVGNLMGAMYFRYFPSVEGADISLFDISVFFVYLILLAHPLIIEIQEVRKWKVLRSKI